MAENFGVNSENWLQISQSTQRFPTKFFELSFARPIILISGNYGDDVNCTTVYSEYFCQFSDTLKRGQIGVKSGSKAKISQFTAKFRHFERQNFAVHFEIFGISFWQYYSFLR